jgi:hypothetical protein
MPIIKKFVATDECIEITVSSSGRGAHLMWERTTQKSSFTKLQPKAFEIGLYEN